MNRQCVGEAEKISLTIKRPAEKALLGGDYQSFSAFQISRPLNFFGPGVGGDSLRHQAGGDLQPGNSE